MEPTEHHIEIGLRVEAAFRLFAEGLERWWPLSYTYSLASFATAGIEPQGHWFERDQQGTRTDWGEVRVYDPPSRLVLAFAISAQRSPEPPQRASEVEVRFLPSGEGTRLELEHRQWERHGDGAEQLSQGMSSPQGWPLILACYARAARFGRLD